MTSTALIGLVQYPAQVGGSGAKLEESPEAIGKHVGNQVGAIAIGNGCAKRVARC